MQLVAQGSTGRRRERQIAARCRSGGGKRISAQKEEEAQTKQGKESL
jgi:hypothetical protein